VDFQLNLDSEPVTRAHPTQPLLVAPEATLRSVLEHMQERGHGSALISAPQGPVQGILTERDIVRLLAQQVDLDVAVQEIMVRDPVTVTRQDTVGKAIALMAQGGYRRMPVVDEQGRPIGMVSAAGILEYLVDHFPKVVYTLPPKPHHTTQEREGA
jgi:CBS domain-containing protein